MHKKNTAFIPGSGCKPFYSIYGSMSITGGLSKRQLEGNLALIRAG
jgi:hypothetical protein